MEQIDKDICEAKQRRAIKDFYLLLEEGNIAYYNSCEVSQIFLYNVKNKSVINYYTLFCFAEIENLDSKTIPVGMIPVTKEYKVGCQKKQISIDNAKKCFLEINQGVLNYDEAIKIPKNLLLPKVLVPKQTTTPVFINEILKPNYWGDNYIIEFYNEQKAEFQEIHFSNQEIEQINNFTYEKLKINLTKPYDRIGNIIFQFPITTICTTISSEKNSVDHKFLLASHPKLVNAPYYIIQMESELDNVITGFDMVEENTLSISITVSPGDDNNLSTAVINKHIPLLIHKSKVNFIKHFNFLGKIGLQYGEPRYIKDRDGNLIEIELFSSINMGSVNDDRVDYFSQIMKRNLNSEVITQSGDCKIYKGNQRAEALKYIRTKLENLSDIKEICLWDPYLTAFDIMETLYFEKIGIPFRCITEYKNAKILNKEEISNKKEAFTFLNFCEQQKQCFLNNSNNLNVKMKFLAQHDIYGWDFHDRFLILVPKRISDLPIVYSLGISVNQLGNSHHTIQKVPDSRKILTNFEELWMLLDNGKCLVAEF